MAKSLGIGAQRYVHFLPLYHPLLPILPLPLSLSHPSMLSLSSRLSCLNTNMDSPQRNLTYHHILRAGHSAPHDRPGAMFNYVRDFVLSEVGYTAGNGTA